MWTQVGEDETAGSPGLVDNMEHLMKILNMNMNIKGQVTTSEITNTVP
jgi:hypothetical protein